MTAGTASLTIQILERLAAELTPRQYDAWTLHHQHGMSIRNIAWGMNISPATVRDHLDAADRRIARIHWEGDAWPWT